MKMNRTELPVFLSSGASFVFLCLFSAICWSGSSRGENQKTVEIRYAMNRFPAYPMELLQAALSTQGTEYKLVGSPVSRQQRRSFVSVKEGGLDITMSMTSQENEALLMPIRIPLYKGLIGLRLMILHEDNQSSFEKIDSLAKLSLFKAGQMHDWPDTQILESNGLKVYHSGSFEGLFKMLVAGRIDYFPRSIIEIYGEVDERPNRGFYVDKNILIFYPTAFYYFVHPEKKSLADDIRRGLEVILKDGRFDDIFMKYHQAYLDKARLGNRKIVRLNNPLLPNKTPLIRKELWLELDSYLTSDNSGN